MRVVIMQPSYLPWLGYFDLFLASDLFLYYDVVQYDKNGWRNRNRIKTPNGPLWLTVPVLTKGLNKPSNKDVRIDTKEPWQRKHIKSLEMNYRKAPHFDEVFPIFEKVLSQPRESLLDLNTEAISEMSSYLGIHTPSKCVSDLKLDLPDDMEANRKLIEICKEVGADEFYEPAGGMTYIEPKLFRDEGIRLTFQNYQHPEYSQLHGNFVSHLSTADLLFNCGRESLSVLDTHRHQKKESIA